MKIAGYIGAVAIGLFAVGAQASAAEHQDRHPHPDSTQQQHQGDTGAPHKRRVDTRHPSHTNPNNTIFRHRPAADYSRWQRNFRAPRRFHVETYHPPRGYSYRRWNYGQYLPWAYYDRSFWMLDFLGFGLMAPPPGCVWVRFGPDALLVDLESGEIIHVVYGVFY